MIDSPEALFAAAPRKSGYIEVGDDRLDIVEMTVKDRIAFVDFTKEHGDDDLSYAFLLSRCCPVLKDTSPDIIKEKLDPMVLVEAGAKIMELSSAGKKPKARKKGLSTD